MTSAIIYRVIEIKPPVSVINHLIENFFFSRFAIPHSCNVLLRSSAIGPDLSQFKTIKFFFFNILTLFSYGFGRVSFFFISFPTKRKKQVVARKVNCHEKEKFRSGKRCRGCRSSERPAWVPDEFGGPIGLSATLINVKVELCSKPTIVTISAADAFRSSAENVRSTNKRVTLISNTLLRIPGGPWLTVICSLRCDNIKSGRFVEPVARSGIKLGS